MEIDGKDILVLRIALARLGSELAAFCNDKTKSKEKRAAAEEMIERTIALHIMFCEMLPPNPLPVHQGSNVVPFPSTNTKH